MTTLPDQLDGEQFSTRATSSTARSGDGGRRERACMGSMSMRGIETASRGLADSACRASPPTPHYARAPACAREQTHVLSLPEQSYERVTPPYSIPSASAAPARGGSGPGDHCGAPRPAAARQPARGQDAHGPPARAGDTRVPSTCPTRPGRPLALPGGHACPVLVEKGSGATLLGNAPPPHQLWRDAHEGQSRSEQTLRPAVAKRACTLRASDLRV